ncbi:MAG TPA: metallophosphoesterase [Bryobacteraceae bacterium]|nr:metallophosphoesterase [Bryobacteraceae bacterium]
MLLYRIHFFPGFCLFVLGGMLQLIIAWWLYPRFRRNAVFYLAVAASTVLLCLGYLLEFVRVERRFSLWWATWLECAGLVEIGCLMGLFLALLVWRSSPQFASPRRTFLRAAGAGLCIAPFASTGLGLIERSRFRLSEVKVPIPNLPPDLDGLTMVQVTDIHLSPFLSEREFARAIDMANETRADLALVTGDLISRWGDPLEACLRQLARLRATAGVLGCLGNHEVYTGTQDYVTAAGRRIGIDFLRQTSKVLRFGNAAINFAGVDYQKFQSPYLLGAERLVLPGVLNVLLSHNPDVFPVAARQGYDLTIAGHTHGGQVNFEILHQGMNIARYYTPYVRGLYRIDKSSVYVSNGLGTIGVPIRLGAPPEVSLLRLCAI